MDPRIRGAVEYQELVTKGCLDHITNLASSDIEKTIVMCLKRQDRVELLSGASKSQSVATTSLLNIFSKSNSKCQIQLTE